MSPLPPPGFFADSPWTDCPSCGTKILKDGTRRCPRCNNRPPRSNMVIGVGGPYRQVSVGTVTELLASYFPTDPITPDFLIQQGNASDSHCLAAALHDGSDLTGWLLTVSGDGAVAGNAATQGTFLAGAAISYHDVGSVDFVRLTMRAEVTGSPGSTAVIYGQRRGTFLPTPTLPDDYLSAPVGALADVSFDYPVDIDGQPWQIANVYTQSWGFHMTCQNLGVADSNVIHLYEYQIDIYGKRLLPP